MKISIDSGFRRGGSLLQWDGEKFTAVKTAHECTWEGDEDTSFTLEVSEGFKGAVVKFYTDADTRVYSAELIGFTAEELQQSSPIIGWMVITIGCRAVKSTRLEYYGWYLVARALNRQIITAESVMVTGEKHQSGNGLVLAKLPCECGDQVSAHYVVFGREGEILGEERNCGDNTPKPVVTDVGWEFTSASIEYQNLLDAMDNADLSEWQEVAVYIRSSYRHGENPLPSLRRQYPGRWEFHKKGTRINSNATVIFSEVGIPIKLSWAVSYTAVEVHRHELPRLIVPPVNSMAAALESVQVQ